MVESVTTKYQMTTYINDAEKLTKNIETYIHWEWDDQARPRGGNGDFGMVST